MELAKIEKLLERYFEAETTVEEEKILKEYFNSDDVVEHLMEYKPMFNYFTISAEDKSTKSIQLSSKNRNLRWLSVAAMLIFMISVYTLYTQDQAEQREAELAYMETQKALNLISQNLNKGTSAIAQLESFNKGTQAISQLENFNKGKEAMAQLKTFEKVQTKVFN